MFRKILIANRGEIACRIIKTAKKMGVLTVAVYSDADKNALHVTMADEAIYLGASPSRDSYLVIDKVITAAVKTGAQAIHPGYGFLSENADFCKACQQAGITFIGPPVSAIEAMGSKSAAKNIMEKAQVPLVPGYHGENQDEDTLKAAADKMGYPVLLKATAGGGGKGMKIANNSDEISHAYKIARSEAKSNFGNDQVYIERYLKLPRHIEIQILADQHGNVVNLGERDCSIQRRHQKIWEEALSPALTSKERAHLGKVVNKAIGKMGYRGLGTLEFLYEKGDFFFMEMNTRIQVEHPITEMVTGIDLVKEQIRVAAGFALPFTQDDIKFTGHAIECRINAECPETFIPSPGKIEVYHAPGGYGIRVDSHMYQGYSVPPHYDSMIAKLIVHGASREEAIARMKRALQEFVITGIKTSIPLHLKLVDNQHIISDDYDIH